MTPRYSTSEYKQIRAEYTKAVGMDVTAQWKTMFVRINEIVKSGAPSELARMKQRKRLNDPNRFYQIVCGDVQRKIGAIEYHFQNYCQLEALALGFGTRLAKLQEAKPSEPLILPTAKLDIETEAFILQTRACLDQFTRSVAYFFGENLNRLSKLKTMLQNNYSKDTKAQRILAIIKASSRFVEDNISRPDARSDRDTIAHYGRLPSRPLSLVQFPEGHIAIVPHIAGSELKTNQTPLSQREVMENIIGDLYHFIFSIYDVLFDDMLSKSTP